jgi:hypothetical protein
VRAVPLADDLSVKQSIDNRPESCRKFLPVGCTARASAAKHCHALPQLGSRSKQPGFGCMDRDVQVRRHVFHGEFLDVAKHKYISQERGNSADFSPEKSSQFITDHFLLRIKNLSGQFNRASAFVRDVPAVNIQEVRALLHPNQHQALVHYNAKQPGKKFGLPLVLIEMLICLNACLLNFVFSFGTIAKHKGSDVDASMPMPCDKFPESVLPAVPRLRHKFQIASIT